MSKEEKLKKEQEKQACLGRITLELCRGEIIEMIGVAILLIMYSYF